MGPEPELQFLLRVPVDGYRIATTTNTSRRGPRERWHLEALGDPADVYERLAPGELFRWLGALNPRDPGAVVAFANKYGGPAKDSDWSSAACSMANAVRLWDMTRERYQQKLKRVVSFRDNLVSFSGEDYAFDGPIFSGETDTPEMRKHVNKNPTRAVLTVLQRSINRELAQETAPVMLWGPKGVNLGLYWRPSTLRGGAFCQLAYAVARGAPHRQCEHCGAWFAYERDSRRYCSGACRTAASRLHRLQAV